MKKNMALIVLGILAAAVLVGCANTGTPTGDRQLDKYNENKEGAKKLGAESPTSQDE